MTEQQIRELVRDAIARAGMTAPPGAGRVLPDPPQSSAAVGRVLLDPALSFRANPSFALLNLAVGADSDGPCLIEPAVPCNHCGYCKSYGH